MDKTSKNILIVFLFALVFYLLYILSSILIPLVFALLFAVMFQPLINRLRMWKVPKFLIIPVVAILSIIIIFFVINILVASVNRVIDQQDYLLLRLHDRLSVFIDWLNSVLNSDYSPEKLYYELYSSFNYDLIASQAGQILSGLSSFTGSFFMFILYYIVILLGITDYKKYLTYVSGHQGNQTLQIHFETIKQSVISYMLIKTLVSLITGLFAYVVCIAFGIKFAFLWGFLTFLLNFIPNIGSIAATVFPVIMGFIQFDSFKLVLFLFISLVSVQSVMGNYVEPRLMGNRLRINTVTVIFGLVFWGFLWGLPGMLLSVPLLVIMKLILEYNPNTAIIARIMSYPETEEEE